MVLLVPNDSPARTVRGPNGQAGVAFDTDAGQAATTRRNLLQMVTADRIAVAGTHLPFPGIGHVEARGDAFAWVPEDWFATRA